MRIAMIGSGYVGLVSGACFAQFGHDVVCVAKEEAKINLSDVTEASVESLFNHNGKTYPISFTLTRAEYNGMIADLVDQALAKADEAVKRADESLKRDGSATHW